MTAVVGPLEGGGGAGRSLLGVGCGAGAPDTLGWRAWTDDAACWGVGAGEFFETAGPGRRWCRRCPVVEVCFWWAVVVEFDAGYHFGIWGDAPPVVRKLVAAVVGVAAARSRLADALCEWENRAPSRGADKQGGERRAG